MTNEFTFQMACQLNTGFTITPFDYELLQIAIVSDDKTFFNSIVLDLIDIDRMISLLQMAKTAMHNIEIMEQTHE